MFSRLSVVVLVAALLTVTISDLLTYPAVRKVLDQRAGDGSADLYTLELHGRVVHAVLWVLFFSILIIDRLWIYRSAIGTRIRRSGNEYVVLFRHLQHSRQETWPVQVLVALIATLARWPFIHLPMRFDESYTYLQYASQPLYVTVAKYDAPNNHVLHSVLVWLATRLGGNSPEVIRTPAFVCGILTCVAAAWWAARRGGRMAGLLAGGMVAVSSPLVEYSVNARGYTLVHLLLMLIWIIGDEWSRKPMRATLILAAGLAALALWTMPTAVYPLLILGVYQWGLARTSIPQGCDPFNETPVVPTPAQGGESALLAPSRSMSAALIEFVRAGVMTAVLTLLLYLPILVVSGPGAITSAGQGQFDEPASWVQGLIASVIESGRLLFRDQPGAALAMLLFCLTIARRARHLVVWISLGLLSCVAVLAIQQVVPPPRTWIFLGPIIACLGAVGASNILQNRPLNQRRFGWFGLIAITCVWPGYHLSHDHSIEQSQETGVCQGAESIIQYLKPQLADLEPIIATSPPSAPLAYYAQRASLPPEHFFAPDLARTRQQRAFVVTSKSPPQTVTEVLQQLQLADTYSRHTIQRRLETPDADVFELTPPQATP